MLQLTQAMGSGALRGDELVSVMEQIPSVGRAIERYLGIAEGSIRNYASENVISADIVKNAVFSMAQETNEDFKSMQMTWSDFTTSLANTGLEKAQPALQFISSIPQTIAENWDSAKPVIMGALAAITAATLALVGSQIAALATNPIFWIIAAVAALTGGIYAGVDAYNTYTNSAETAWGTIAGFFGELSATIINVGYQIFSFLNGIINLAMNLLTALGNFAANVFIDPAAAIVGLFADVATAVLSFIEKIAQGWDAITGQNLTNSVRTWMNQVKGWKDTWTNPENNPLSTGAYKDWMEDYFDIDDLWEQVTGWRPGKVSPQEWRSNAVNQGNNFDNWFDDFGKNLTTEIGNTTDETLKKIEEWLKNQNLGNGESNEYEPYISKISNNTDALKKEVSMAEEDIKMLVDMAEREYVANVNLTAQSPVITVNATSNDGSAIQPKAIADAIKNILIDQSSSHTVRTYSMI